MPTRSACRRRAALAYATAPLSPRPPTLGRGAEWCDPNSSARRCAHSPSHEPGQRARGRTLRAQRSGGDGAPVGARETRPGAPATTRRTVSIGGLPGILGARARLPPPTAMADTSTVGRVRARLPLFQPRLSSLLPCALTVAWLMLGRCLPRQNR